MEKSYRILLTNLFHNRESKITHSDMNEAMEKIDKHKCFPVFYKRMEFYFDTCEQVLTSYLKPWHPYDLQTKYSNFIKYIYDAIGQSVMYLKKHYPTEYYKVLHKKFRQIVLKFLEKVDEDDVRLTGGDTKFRKLSVLQFFGSENRVEIDKDTDQRLKKMGIKDLLVDRYIKWADGLKIVEEMCEDYSVQILPEIYNFCENSGNSTISQNDFWLQERLEKYLLKIRVADIYGLCCDFPDCSVALDELRTLIDSKHAWIPVTLAMRDIIEARICTPHVSTSDLITCYIYAVQVLGRLESGENDTIPSGQLLSALEPVQIYLQKRGDTVTEIVQSMLDSNDEEGNVLAHEMQTFNSKKVLTDEERFEEGMNWKPTKPGARNKCSVSSRYSKKPKDMLSLMLGLYGSTDKFIKAYQRILVGRLIHIFRSLETLDIQPSQSSDFEQERVNLELLKSRFDQDTRRSLLDSCSVMFRDWEGSLRFHRESKKEEDGFNVLLISDQCWNTIKDIIPLGTGKLEVNEAVQKKMEEYNKLYQANKGSRSVQFFGGLGEAEIEIDMEDGSPVMTVLCDQTAISVLDFFVEKAEWTITELTQKLKITRTVTCRYIEFWKKKLVIRENAKTQKFCLANDEQSKLARIRNAEIEQQLMMKQMNGENSGQNANDVSIDVDIQMDDVNGFGQATNIEGEVDGKNEDWVKPFEMYWKTICNFIRIKKNQASVDEIHGKISIYAQLEPDSDDSEEEGFDVTILANKKKLKMFLGRKIRENKLIHVDDDRYALVES